VKRFILILLLISHAVVWAKSFIEDITSLRDVDTRLRMGKFQEPVLIALDIHGTLAEARAFHGIGSDCAVRQLTAQGVPFAQVCSVWQEVQERINLADPFESAAHYITSWKAQYSVIGLTGGLVELAGRYPEQLAGLNISMAGNAGPFRQDLTLETPDKRNAESRQNIAFRSGILAVGPFVSKGQGLRTLLQRVGFRPATVVFVDNEARYLEELRELFGVDEDFYGFRIQPSAWELQYDPSRFRTGLSEFVALHGTAVSKCSALLSSLVHAANP
jgi:hypothetical protein